MSKKLSDFSVQVIRKTTKRVEVHPDDKPTPIKSETKPSIKIDFTMHRHVRNDVQHVVYNDQVINERWRDPRADFPTTLYTIKRHLHQAGLNEPEADQFIRLHLLPLLKQKDKDEISRMSIVVNMNATLRESVKMEAIQRINVAGNCSICRTSLSRSPNLSRLPCSHEFHQHCIESWLLRKTYSCPCCRYAMPIRKVYLTTRLCLHRDLFIPCLDFGYSLFGKVNNVEWLWNLAKAMIFVKLGHLLLK